jgi:hypothetical protein
MKRVAAIFSITIVLLHAQVPHTAMLEQTPDNAALVFKSDQSRLICKPFGVRTLEEIAGDRRTNTLCKALFEGYAKRNPGSRQYAASTLKRFQFYRIEPVQERCILYAKGRVSYSEMLLHEGLAVIKRGEVKRELRRSFERAEAGARKNRRGIWKEALAVECAEVAATLQGDKAE